MLYNIQTPLKRLYIASHIKQDVDYQRWNQEAKDLKSILPL
jgi:hypothetical protein